MEVAAILQSHVDVSQANLKTMGQNLKTYVDASNERMVENNKLVNLLSETIKTEVLLKN